MAAPLLLAGCGGDGTKATKAPAATPTSVVGLPPAQLCDALARIVGEEGGAFAGLRGAALGNETWRGALVPPGLAGCSVAGSRHPGSQYVCWGPAVPSRDALAELTPTFDRLVSHVDACLGTAPGRPVGLTRGAVLVFAGGERMALWRDRNASPTAALALRIEEDFRTGGYTLSLVTQTVR